ncbi:MAG TPA: gas vesicle protein K [Micromonosporaceae bacterium]
MSTPPTGRHPARLDIDADQLGEGLGRLVLALLEIVRQLVERQALRRVDGGDLTDEEVERLGLALMALDQRFAELRDVFGVSERDLALPLDIRGLDQGYPTDQNRREGG